MASEATLWISLSLALCCAAAAVWLWSWAGQRQRRERVQQHLNQGPQAHWTDLALAGQTPAGAGASASTSKMSASVGRALLGWWLGVWSERQLALVALGGLAFVFLVVLALGWWAGMFLLVVMGALWAFTTWLRVSRRRQQLIQELPPFLDAMVRLISIGHSTQAAFQQAVVTAKTNLQPHLVQVAALVQAGMPLEQAVQQSGQQLRLDEFQMLGAVLGLSVRYGGRTDLLLERMANFMRDREQAQHELRAMSAETRLSAWILGLLPLVVGGAIVLINASYFLRLWSDSTGQTLVLAALALQALGGLLLYRLTRVV